MDTTTSALRQRFGNDDAVALSSGGRRDAFETLGSRWQKRLGWHAFNLTGRAEAAWDVTQESWLDIVRRWARLKETAKFAPGPTGLSVTRRMIGAAETGACVPSRSRRTTRPPPTAEEGRRETAGDVHDILRRLPARSQVVESMAHRHSIKRDLKRLELSLAELSEALKARP